jgi:hypothetical protein
MNLGHIIYLGSIKDVYLNTFVEETASFINVQNINLTIWDESMIQNLISESFEDDVLVAYNKIKPYAYKSDLARLCILYVHGGWYSDIGIKFLNKINTDKEILVFRDRASTNIFDYTNLIQNSIIYSIPGQPKILECINRLSKIYISEHYGNDPAYVGGLVQMGIVFDKITVAVDIGEMGKNFTTLDDLESGKTTLEYFYNDVHVANFKDFKKKSQIPLAEPDKMLWGKAWESKNLYT